MEELRLKLVSGFARSQHQVKRSTVIFEIGLGFCDSDAAAEDDEGPPIAPRGASLELTTRIHVRFIVAVLSTYKYQHAHAKALIRTWSSYVVRKVCRAEDH